MIAIKQEPAVYTPAQYIVRLSRIEVNLLIKALRAERSQATFIESIPAGPLERDLVALSV